MKTLINILFLLIISISASPHENNNQIIKTILSKEFYAQARSICEIRTQLSFDTIHQAEDVDIIIPLYSIKNVSNIMLNSLKAKDNIGINDDKIRFNRERSLRAIKQTSAIIDKYLQVEPELKTLSADPFYLEMESKY